MKSIINFIRTMLLLSCLIGAEALSQGTFQNLDFENPTFIPIQGNPPFFVEPGPALPGWAAYIGTNLAQHVLHNTLSLSTPEIAIYGPDNPAVDFLHGHYYVVLQNSFPFPTDIPSIAQVGQLPPAVQSIRFLTRIPVPTIGLAFAGQQLGTPLLEDLGNSRYLWGADISQYAGQIGELRFFGEGYLDFIQFSNQPIPEPSVFGLFAIGALLLGWRFVWRQRRPT